MIASLRGTCQFLSISQCVVDVGGVGYLVAITPTTSMSMSNGAQVELLTSMIVREDAMQLFGFLSEAERLTFEILRSVAGVGPKSALAVLTGMTAHEVAVAVANEDDAAFRAITGIGPKTAKLICVSLAGKLQQIGPTASKSVASYSTSHILEALVGLGWNAKLAEAALERAVASSNDSGDAALLKLALADLGQSKSVGAK